MRKISSRLIISIIFLALISLTLFKILPSESSSAASFNSDTINTPKDETPAKPLTLNVIARIGPWPYTSRLIGYRGRLWFANSVKFRNHNSSDIWSLDPKTGKKRLERNLFSQDAGEPLVHNGLLYWPHEDALFARGNGEISFTNGEEWHSQTIDTALIYHTSELHDWDGDLLAVTGARNAGLQLSKDGGASWSELYDHVTQSPKIGRIREITRVKDNIYATLRDEKVLRLVVWTGETFENVKGLPLNQPLRGLTQHDDVLFALIGPANKREIWRYDGKKAQSLGRINSFTDLTSDGEKLWTVTRDGKLFSITSENIWQRHTDLSNGKPMSITVVDGAIYVAGTGDNKRGIIWGQLNHNISNAPAPEISKTKAKLEAEIDWNSLGTEIDALLSDSATYDSLRSGQPTQFNKLTALLNKAANHHAPDGFFTQRFNIEIPDINITTFERGRETKLSEFVHVTILTAMERGEQKDVPPTLFEERWKAPANPIEKYIVPQIIALKVIANTGQNDDATLNALIKRLDHQTDPDWYRSMVLGTLTAITNEHYGYDIEAWQKWHKAR